jgi:hypothetical protein
LSVVVDFNSSGSSAEMDTASNEREEDRDKNVNVSLCGESTGRFSL